MQREIEARTLSDSGSGLRQSPRPELTSGPICTAFAGLQLQNSPMDIIGGEISNPRGGDLLAYVMVFGTPVVASACLGHRPLLRDV